MKDAVKRLARPLTSRILARIDARVAPVRAEVSALSRNVDPLRSDVSAIKEHVAPMVARVQTHDRLTAESVRGIAELQQAIGTVNRHLPSLLNAISSQNAAVREARRAELQLREELAGLQRRLDDDAAHFDKRINEAAAHLSERVGRVEQRTEFVRREVLFEQRYGGTSKGMGRSSAPEIAAPEKVAGAAGDIRLNLGCGHIPIDGFINVDGRPLDHVDVVAEVGDLPFEPGTVNHIHSAHLLEHFPLEELRRRLLPYWFERLRPGGVFTAVVPDAETMLAEHAAGRLSFEDLRQVTFGDQEYDGDFHFNMFSQESLSDLLRSVGFVAVEVIEAGRRNGVCYEMELRARRPSAG